MQNWHAQTEFTASNIYFEFQKHFYANKLPRTLR